MRRFDHLELQPATTQDATISLTREPDRDEHHWMQAALDERRTGNAEAALRYYSRALESNRSVAAAWAGQVRMLIAMGEYPEADLWARKALELFKNNADLLAGRAQALCRTGDLKTAQASCDAAISQPGMSSYPWLARGELMLARRESTADYCFDKAVQLDADWLVLLEIAEVFRHYGRRAKALVWATRTVERAPDSPHVWCRRGELEREMGLLVAAERSFRACVQLSPHHRVAGGHLLQLANDRRGLRNWFKRVFRIGHR
ncbi:MAG TPA: hypothetical protein VF624_18065 [Tepidisphaeraceae bacterium]